MGDGACLNVAAQETNRLPLPGHFNDWFSKLKLYCHFGQAGSPLYLQVKLHFRPKLHLVYNLISLFYSERYIHHHFIYKLNYSLGLISTSFVT